MHISFNSYLYSYNYMYLIHNMHSTFRGAPSNRRSNRIPPVRWIKSSLLTTYWSESTLSSWWLVGPASRNRSLNFFFQEALHLPSCAVNISIHWTNSHVRETFVCTHTNICILFTICICDYRELIQTVDPVAPHLCGFHSLCVHIYLHFRKTYMCT